MFYNLKDYKEFYNLLQFFKAFGNEFLNLIKIDSSLRNKMFYIYLLLMNIFNEISRLYLNIVVILLLHSHKIYGTFFV